MAKMVKSFFQGRAWKDGSKKIVAHRSHRVNKNQKKRNRLGAAPVPFKRNGKKSQRFMEQRKWEIRHYKYIKWMRENPSKPKKDNPFRVKPEPFRNTEMRDALVAAGVVKS